MSINDRNENTNNKSPTLLNSSLPECAAGIYTSTLQHSAARGLGAPEGVGGEGLELRGVEFAVELAEGGAEVVARRRPGCEEGEDGVGRVVASEFAGGGDERLGVDRGETVRPSVFIQKGRTREQSATNRFNKWVLNDFPVRSGELDVSNAGLSHEKAIGRVIVESAWQQSALRRRVSRKWNDMDSGIGLRLLEPRSDIKGQFQLSN